MKLDLSGRIERSLNWQRDLIFYVMLLICMAAFQMRGALSGLIAGCDPGESLDGRWTGYCVAEATTYLENLGPKGRSLYASTQLTLDLAFPLLYGSLFALLSVRCLCRNISRWFVYLPVAMALADWSENFLTAVAACRFKSGSKWMIPPASIFTQLKWWLGGAILVGFPILLILGCLFRRRCNTPPN